MPRQLALGDHVTGAIVAVAKRFADQVDVDIGCVAGAAQVHAAAQAAAAVRQQVVQLQGRERRIEFDVRRDPSLRIQPALSERQGDIARIGIAIDVQVAVAGQRAPTQHAAEILGRDVGEQSTVVAQLTA